MMLPKLILRISGSTPTPWSGSPMETMVWDHGIPLRAPKTLEIKGFLGLERPFLDLVSQTLRPRGRGRPLFAEIQNNKKSVTVSGNFPKLFPRNYESVTFEQFWEGGGKDTDGPIGNGNFY